MEELTTSRPRFFEDHQSFTIGDLRLEIEKKELVEITGWSVCQDFTVLTESHSLTELERIKISFLKMVQVSKELKNMIQGRTVKYNLYFDDYNKGSIEICSERNGSVEWKIDLKE